MMKKQILLVLFLLPLLSYAQDRLYFASQPTLSPDAKNLYFCYDGGIWHVPAIGGTAARVTSMTGYQLNPKVSPDGKWLAFSADEQGNNNVYVMPVEGGAIRQLTFHEANDMVSSWSADSKYVYFESNRYNGITTYRVNINGGTPERLFSGYFNTVTYLVENPVDGAFYFNEASEGFSQATRKGYKGANNPDIHSWNPKKKEFKNITTYIGKDLWPSIDKQGNLFWATDEKNGEYNLATLQNGKPHILTDYTTAIHQPQVSNDGSKVVFTKDYMIHLFDVKTGTTTVPSIKVFESNRPDIALSYTTDGNITTIDISPDGKKIAFVSRGRLFVSDTKGLFIQPIPTDPLERVVEIAWAKDNKTIYYTRTKKGWYNLYKVSAEKPGSEKAVYSPEQMVKGLTMSNDRSMIAFVTGSDKIELLYTADDRVEKISDNEFWSFHTYNISFSQDDKFLAYTAMNLFERDVFVYDLKTKKVTNLTNSATVENSPAWSTDGKYLYLTANRYSTSFPRGAQGSLYRIRLDYSDKPYIKEEYNQLFSTDTTKKTKSTQISLNMEDIQRRWERVVSSGSQSSVQVLKNGDKSFLLYGSNHEGEWAVYVQELKDFDQQPAKKITGLTSPSGWGYNGKNLYALQRGSLYSVDLAGASSKKIELKYSYSKNNRNEFEQMFYEVWTLIAANFYDPSFHGVDWNAKQTYYAGFLPHIKSRRDLRSMINDMLGELNSSHLGFTSRGNEERRETSMQTIKTGLMFDNQSPYKVSSILKGTPAYTVGQKIKPGDILTAVNGKPVDPKTSREYYFASSVAMPEITLQFKRGEAVYDVTLHTSQTAYSQIFYTQWEDDCRERVKKKTNDRVAYHHMRDMGNGSLDKFYIDMSTDAVHKDALILDLRYNNGGNVHDEVLEYLSRKQHFTWKYRDKQSNTHPNVTPGNKPIVVLINERSLSDAEVTSNGIQTLGIGKLIGTETYRWIIFTSGAMLVDGSFCRLPSWGCYNLDGKDMEFAGVAPDIYVKNTFTDRLNGEDPQLDHAIEEILKELK